MFLHFRLDLSSDILDYLCLSSRHKNPNPRNNFLTERNIRQSLYETKAKVTSNFKKNALLYEKALLLGIKADTVQNQIH